MMSHSLIAPPEPFKAIIFDCDGTLADTMPTHVKAWVASYKSFGIDIAEQPFYDMGGMNNQRIIETLNTQFGYTMDFDAMQEAKEGRYLEMLHTITEVKAVADIARAYHGKVPIAVASSGMRRVVSQTLAQIDLSALFDVIVTADDVEHAKPAPDIFLLAAERLGVAPADCIIYEDGDPGLEAARRANMRAVDVRVLWRDEAK